ncbi:MAG: hypothetical protein CMQ19_11430 [Gammaproteobacteria bacterium]|jgi:mono/diheme cytochrome c family protein|nr:hypothetical protein [Gammaproteobacteria bacterium]|tara:strand:- start:689 stop:1075 length:387 start_codon:yes stop_codon:yes gene_type:complete
MINNSKLRNGTWHLVLGFVAVLISETSIAQDIEAGKALFQTNCATCHGEKGDGNGPAAEGFILKPRDFALAAFKFDTDSDWVRGADADLANVIRNGTAAYGGSQMMAPWGQLSDQEIKNLVGFIRSLE